MGKNLSSEARHEEYLFFKARGICPVCRKRKIAEGFARCAVCLEYSVVWSAKRDKSAYNRRKRELYAQHKADGICVQCKSRPARDGKTKCEVCAQSESRRAKANRVHVVKPDGICWRKGCSEPTVNGTRCCAAHHREMVEHAHMMRETAKRRGTWKGWDNRWLFTPI